MKIKKLLLLFLALCTVLSLAACAPPDATEPTDTTTPTTPNEEMVLNAEELIATGELLYPAKNDLFRYDVYTTYVAITEYVGSATTVEVPAKLEELPVLRIAKGAFAKTHIENITIADSVVEIGSVAFEECQNLVSVKLPSQVTSIGTEAFTGCVSLKEITIPASLKNIPTYMCQGCKNLVTVVWEDIEEDDGIKKTIGDFAFQSCKSLTMIWIPDEVTEIGNSAIPKNSFLTIHGYTSSAAAHYASKYFIDFEVLDKENLATAIKDAQDEAAKREEESTKPTESTTP